MSRGLARAVPPGRVPRPPPVLLDPRAPVPLCGTDRTEALRGGVLGVDCSWNRLEERGGYPAESPWLARLPTRRRLPLLLAGNPQHYGRLAELNTAEALCAALFLLGEPDRAREILGRFGGGEAFFSLNREPLESYSAAGDAAALLAEERQYF